jgi:hypothetical protein
VPLVCALSPLVCYGLGQNAPRFLGGYRFGFELLLLNGLLTAGGLFLLRRPAGRDTLPAAGAARAGSVEPLLAAHPRAPGS